MANGNAYHEIGFWRPTINKVRRMGLDYNYWFYRLKWNLLSKYPFYTKKPLHIDLELASYCNLKCIMCPHSSDDKRIESGFMDKKLAFSLIEQAVAIGVSSLKFSGRGEVTMHPNFLEILIYAKQKGIMDVMFNTNALLLDKNMAESIVNNNINLIIISIDGATRDTYEKIRIGSDFDKVVSNINYLIDYRNSLKKKKPLIRLQFVKMKDNIAEFDMFKKQWENKVDVLVGLDYSKRLSQENKTIKNREIVGRTYCPHPWRRLTITSSANMLMCCADWECKYPIGNAYKDSIADVWNSPKIKYARECILKKEHHKIASCKNCFVPISYEWKEQ